MNEVKTNLPADQSAEAPALPAGRFAKADNSMKQLLTIIIIFIAFLTQPTSTLAISREDLVRSARVGSSVSTSVNIITNVIHLGGSQIVGNSASNGTALQTIQDAVNRLNLLRNRLRIR